MGCSVKLVQESGRDWRRNPGWRSSWCVARIEEWLLRAMGLSQPLAERFYNGTLSASDRIRRSDIDATGKSWALTWSSGGKQGWELPRMSGSRDARLRGYKETGIRDHQRPERPVGCARGMVAASRTDDETAPGEAKEPLSYVSLGLLLSFHGRSGRVEPFATSQLVRSTRAAGYCQ